MQRLVVDLDILAQKLAERGFTPAEIDTAIEVIKEMEIPSEATR